MNNLRNNKPRLFGISSKSNRDTGGKSLWGKNEFNSSFPTALLCYMDLKNIKPVYIKTKENLEIRHANISVEKLFNLSPKSDNIYFAFESEYDPYKSLVRAHLDRSDLVIMDISKNEKKSVSCFEIKLTALPDSSTVSLNDDRLYSCEMVFRPTAIVHLALSIAQTFNKTKKSKEKLRSILNPVCSEIFNWRSKLDVIDKISAVSETLDMLINQTNRIQTPFIIQPVWKTEGKRSILADNCLDVFVWSNYAFTRLFLSGLKPKDNKMTRGKRCIFWLIKMLYDFSQIGIIDPGPITSEMAYELQTDKAFSISGKHSWKFLKGKNLTKPRIEKREISNIILNGGQDLLSPERRFDAAIVNTKGIFERGSLL